MRAVVFSDSHGNYDVLEQIMERHKEDGDVFIHLGDGERELELIQYVYNDKKIYFVSGNCDWGTDKPDYDIIKFGGKTICKKKRGGYSSLRSHPCCYDGL